jgi:flagellar protein FliJ
MRVFWAAHRQRERRCLAPRGCGAGVARAMKLNDTMLKLRRFEVNEKQQKVIDIETMIADFKRMADDLNHQIKVEEETSGVRDVNHYAYPTYAKAARQRRDNLLASIGDLEAKLEEARGDLNEANEELKKSELVEERTQIEHERSANHSVHGMNAIGVGPHCQTVVNRA